MFRGNLMVLTNAYFGCIIDNWNQNSVPSCPKKISGEILMKRFFVILIAVAALFIFSSVAIAQTNSAKPKKTRIATRGKVEAAPKRKTLVAQKRAVTAPKPVVQKAAVPKKEGRGTKVMYIKVVTPVPWYYNAWILLMGGSGILLLGALLGRLLKLGPIPRRSVENVEPGRLKRFICRFKKDPMPVAI
jgi:hypothetical protein